MVRFTAVTLLCLSVRLVVMGTTNTPTPAVDPPPTPKPTPPGLAPMHPWRLPPELLEVYDLTAYNRWEQLVWESDRKTKASTVKTPATEGTHSPTTYPAVTDLPDDEIAELDGEDPPRDISPSLTPSGPVDVADQVAENGRKIDELTQMTSRLLPLLRLNTATLQFIRRKLTTVRILHINESFTEDSTFMLPPNMPPQPITLSITGEVTSEERGSLQVMLNPDFQPPGPYGPAGLSLEAGGGLPALDVLLIWYNDFYQQTSMIQWDRLARWFTGPQDGVPAEPLLNGQKVRLHIHKRGDCSSAYVTSLDGMVTSGAVGRHCSPPSFDPYINPPRYLSLALTGFRVDTIDVHQELQDNSV